MIKGWLILTSCVTAFAASIVVPNANTSTAGNNNIGAPDSPTPAIIQALYSASQFPGLMEITGLSFREAPGTGPGDFNFANLSVFLDSSPNSTSGPLMSTTFANNFGNSNTRVFSGANVTLSGAGCTGPGSCAFNLNLLFTNPFYYDPASGNLLLTLTTSGVYSPGGNSYFDGVGFNAPGGSAAEVFEIGDRNSNTGTLMYGAPIVAFTYTPVTILNSFQGGSVSLPVVLTSTLVGGITGTIGGDGSEEYYLFSWAGGAFSATATVNLPTGTAYAFSEGVVGSCNSGGSQTLNTSDNFTGTISIANLPAGQYCIGINADSLIDPTFAITFNTPVGGVPEPSGFGLLAIGFGAIGVRRLKRSVK